MGNFECGSECDPTVSSVNLRNANIFHVSTTTSPYSSSTMPVHTTASSTPTSISMEAHMSTNLFHRRDKYNYGSLFNSSHTEQQQQQHHNVNSNNNSQMENIHIESVSYDNPVVYNRTKMSLGNYKKRIKSIKDKKISSLNSNSTVVQTLPDSLNIHRPSHTGIHHQILSLPQDYHSISLTNSMESNLHQHNTTTIQQTPHVEIQNSHGWFSSTDEEEEEEEEENETNNHNVVGAVNVSSCSSMNNKIISKQAKKYLASVNHPNTIATISNKIQLPTHSTYSTMIGQEFLNTSRQSTLVRSNNNTVDNEDNNVENNQNDKLNDANSISLTDDRTDVISEFIPMHKMNVLLYVSDLSRKRYGTLNRKYLLYFWYLIIISIFYGLPAVQLIMTYQKAVFETGNEDLCYYNFECAHSFGIFTAFNNIISNIGYVMLGLLFLGLTARRDILHRRTKNVNPNSQILGIPQHYGLFYAMGLALTMEGLMSACYHMCPNFSNFQFDTAYMYILAMLIMLKIYQTRHPDVNASAHSAYMVMAVVIFLGVLGVVSFT
ncbi:unnamed protein product [Schistosoma turkestanicum]|nr:unnamed protein product [Schistosoma turkestanicum]